MKFFIFLALILMLTPSAKCYLTLLAKLGGLFMNNVYKAKNIVSNVASVPGRVVSSVATAPSRMFNYATDIPGRIANTFTAIPGQMGNFFNFGSRGGTAGYVIPPARGGYSSTPGRVTTTTTYVTPPPIYSIPARTTNYGTSPPTNYGTYTPTNYGTYTPTNYGTSSYSNYGKQSSYYNPPINPAYNYKQPQTNNNLRQTLQP
eukprot:GHVR01014776.1.p1 GENE.GHVR01014776.1~~GHVR01014776.1.p1  ORF type:complete len:203 (-),score=16.39 GHVR01014776.1:145-753(-)